MATAINHIGLTVTDVNEAIAFYTQVLGYSLIVGPLPIVPDDSHFGQLAGDILGPRLQSGQFAHLLTGNGVGLELFQFDDPQAGQKEAMQYWRNGYFHVCITAPDVEAKVAEIVAAGGRQTTKVWEVLPGTDYKLAYCEDPFGNAIELYSVDYATMWQAVANAA